MNAYNTRTIQNVPSLQAEVSVYYSSNGGNDWKVTPIKMPRGKFCERLENDYRKFVMKGLHAVSNMPYTEDPNEKLCPMFTKVFWMDMFFLFHALLVDIFFCV